MPNLLPFEFENHPIRAITAESGEVLLVAKDVCEALGYVNHSDAIKQHCHGVAKYYPIVDSLGREQEARVIAEPDVMRLIMKSNLPAAEKFERWVFEEVLPSIRKTGSYSVKPKPVEQMFTRRNVDGSFVTVPFEGVFNYFDAEIERLNTWAEYLVSQVATKDDVQGLGTDLLSRIRSAAKAHNVLVDMVLGPLAELHANGEPEPLIDRVNTLERTVARFINLLDGPTRLKV